MALLPAQIPNLSLFRDTLRGKNGNTIWTTQFSQLSALTHGSYFPSIPIREELSNHGRSGPRWVGPCMAPGTDVTSMEAASGHPAWLPWDAQVPAGP